jgi:hypothetical protein
VATLDCQSRIGQFDPDTDRHMKKCTLCKNEIVNWKPHLRSRCRQCRNKRLREHYKAGYGQKKALKVKEVRSKRIAYTIVSDSRASDRRCFKENDIDELFVSNLIANGCVYCGDKDSRMSVDRIDNSIGHIKSNVTSSCLRCNYLRRDMPFQAWLCIAPSIREAREKGLFGKWEGRARK